MAMCYQAGEGQRGEQHGGDGSAFESKDAHRRSETSSGATARARAHQRWSPGRQRLLPICPLLASARCESIDIATRKNSVDVEHFGLPVRRQEGPLGLDTTILVAVRVPL